MDGFFGIGFLELLLIAILALIVLGPERLPSALRELAKYMRQLRRIGSEFTQQFSEEFKALDEINPRKIFNEMTDPNQPDPTGAVESGKATAPAKASPPKTSTPAVKPAPPVAKPASAVATASDLPSENSILPPAAPSADPALPSGSVLLPDPAPPLSAPEAVPAEVLPPAPPAEGAP